MKTAIRFAGFLLSTATLAFAHDPPAFRLGDVATPTAYEARLEIDPRATTFAGEIRIDLKVNRATPVLWLNATGLTVESADFTQGPRKVAVKILTTKEDFVGFEGDFSAGATTAVIRYRAPLEPVATRGIFKQVDKGESYVISQFEAMNARRAYPCFDEPGWKTPWKLTIDAPAANVVVSNTPEIVAMDLAERAGWRRHTFAQTKPLPSYLVALAVGPFDVVDGGTAGKKKTPLRYLVPKGRAAETAWIKESTPRLLELHEEYYGMPYPFEKLDSVTIPQAVGFGAMENVGMITYSSALMLATPREETEQFRRSYAGLASHEIAHMWFGNLVTLAWWDDIWLNESFASWAGNKVLYRFRPEWDTGTRRAFNRNRAISVDRLASARRVRNPVVVKEDMGGVFDSITYDKGSEVLQMFESRLGAEPFQRGVQKFLERHAWGTATSADFFRAVGEASGRAEEVLKAFSEFVDQPGAPLIDLALRCDGAKPAIDVSQQRLRPKGSKAENANWTTPACFRAGERVQCEEVTSEPRTVPLADTATCPDWVVGNAGGVGHYVVRYEARLDERILANLGKVPSHEAAALLSDRGLLAESGLVPIDPALKLAEAGLAHASHVVNNNAVVLLEKLRDEWLPPKALEVKRAIVARRLVPLARELGWQHAERDGIEVRTLRSAAIALAAQYPGGEALRSEARALALRWIGDRSAVDASLVTAVLDTTARFADAATYEKLEAEAFRVQDRREKGQLLRALAKVRDPALRARALALATAKAGEADRIDGRETLTFLEFALRDEVNRRAALDFVRAQFEPLVAKLPQQSPGFFTTWVDGLCKPADRAQFVDFFEARSAKFLGGPRRYRQALETIDLCVAAHG